METVTHLFDGIEVYQRAGDSFVDMTSLQSAASANIGKEKKFSTYMTLRSTKEFLEALKDDLQCNEPCNQDHGITSPVCVVESRKGSSSDSNNGQGQGTWVHLEVAIDYCQWVSPKFRVKANRVLRQALTGEFQPITSQAAETIQSLSSELGSMAHEISGLKETVAQLAKSRDEMHHKVRDWQCFSLLALQSSLDDEAREAAIIKLRKDLFPAALPESN